MSWRDYASRIGGGLAALGAGGMLSVVIIWGTATTGRLTWPLWPYGLCGGIFAAGAILYAVGQEWIPGLRRKPGSRKAGKTAKAPVKPSLDPASMAIVRETDYKTLRIVLTNKTAADTFQAEITNITNKRGRALTEFEEPWPIPWTDDPSGAPKLLDAAETAKMDLTTLTHSEPFELRQHLWWTFQSPHGPVRVLSEERRKVLVTVGISRADSDERIDRTFELSRDIDNNPIFSTAK